MFKYAAMTGQFFETYAVSEIIKSYYNAGKRPQVFYYRDTDQKEIDLILEANNTLCPFEIKKSASPDKNAVRHFGILSKTGKEIGVGGVICMTDSVYPISNENYYVPIWLIWMGACKRGCCSAYYNIKYSLAVEVISQAASIQ